MKTTNRTPKHILHEYCHYCIQDKRDSEVENCGGDFCIVTGRQCPFFPYRMGKKRPPMKVFRQFCLECMGGSRKFVRECITIDCQLYPYRFGKNPAKKGADAERMAQIRRPETMFSTVKSA